MNWKIAVLVVAGSLFLGFFCTHRYYLGNWDFWADPSLPTNLHLNYIKSVSPVGEDLRPYDVAPPASANPDRRIKTMLVGYQGSLTPSIPPLALDKMKNWAVSISASNLQSILDDLKTDEKDLYFSLGVRSDDSEGLPNPTNRLHILVSKAKPYLSTTYYYDISKAICPKPGGCQLP